MEPKSKRRLELENDGEQPTKLPKLGHDANVGVGLQSLHKHLLQIHKIQNQIKINLRYIRCKDSVFLEVTPLYAYIEENFQFRPIYERRIIVSNDGLAKLECRGEVIDSRNIFSEKQKLITLKIEDIDFLCAKLGSEYSICRGFPTIDLTLNSKDREKLKIDMFNANSCHSEHCEYIYFQKTHSSDSDILRL